jgi:hypothetical protein
MSRRMLGVCPRQAGVVQVLLNLGVDRLKTKTAPLLRHVDGVQAALLFLALTGRQRRRLLHRGLPR